MLLRNILSKELKNNIIFDTKNRKNADTQKLIEKVCGKLKEEENGSNN